MPAQNLKIVWIGFHEEGVPALLSLRESGIRLDAVITLTDAASAVRCASAAYDEVLSDWDVPLHHVRNINDADSIRLLKQLEPDLLLVIGWSQIVGKEALSTARTGAVGAHASLLPHHRGSAPVNWSLIRGEAVTGNSLIWLSQNVDEGEIIDQTEIAVSVYDTCQSIYQKVAESNRDMILRLLPRLFAGERPGTAQPASDEPILARRRPQDGLIDWTQAAEDIYNFVRALTRPYPGAFSFLDQKKWIVQSCALLPYCQFGSVSPGQIIGPMLSPVENACGILVACGAGAIVVLETEDESGHILKGRQLSQQAWAGKVWSNG